MTLAMVLLYMDMDSVLCDTDGVRLKRKDTLIFIANLKS